MSYQQGHGDALADKEILRDENRELRAEIVRLRESRQKRLDEIAADMPRWQTLTLDEQLRDRGVAMKNVPMFAVKTMADAADEIDKLREAIRRLAEQDATLSVCNGNVTVTMDATLTDEERNAIESAASDNVSDAQLFDAEYSEELRARAATLRGLLERTK